MHEKEDRGILTHPFPNYSTSKEDKYSVKEMPRCFLAKKSLTSNTHWSEDTNNNHEDNESTTAAAAATAESTASHRSTIGSISAAKAVLSIQQPICPPPAHQASILAASTITKAMAGFKPSPPPSTPPTTMLEQNNNTNNNNMATQTSWTTSSSAAELSRVKTAARPPRRKKSQRPPLNLVMPENLSKKVASNISSSGPTSSNQDSGLTILRAVVTSGKSSIIIFLVF